MLSLSIVHHARRTKSETVPVAHDGVGFTDVLPTSVIFHHWTLGFGQFSSRHIAQALRAHALHVFGHLPLSNQALVPSPFRV
jgi:hypothetical protein